MPGDLLGVVSKLHHSSEYLKMGVKISTHYIRKSPTDSAGYFCPGRNRLWVLKPSVREKRKLIAVKYFVRQSSCHQTLYVGEMHISFKDVSMEVKSQRSSAQGQANFCTV